MFPFHVPTAKPKEKVDLYINISCTAYYEKQTS